MGGYVVPAASDLTVTSHAGASGATANGIAGLTYGFHIKQLPKRLSRRALRKFSCDHRANIVAAIASRINWSVVANTEV